MLGNIAGYSSFFFQLACMLAWGYTLIRLYRDIEHSEKLLPNKRIFILQGSLLISYLILFALKRILGYLIPRANYTENQILRGINDIFFSIDFVLQLMTFFLVVKIMLPVTPSDKESRSKFQRFLFKGFADSNELRAAVLAKNPEMDQSQL